ncbi:MAG: GGDEF domain-containing protein [Planctomycetota bacterium]|nr:MAG: GGDEF domain-containing protein [Planctomycetota bacterium]
MDTRRLPVGSISGPFHWPPLAAVVRLFVPQQLRRTPELFREGQRVVALHLALFVWGPVYAVVMLLLGALITTLILLVTGGLNIGSLLLLRVTKSPAVCGNVLAGVIWLSCTSMMLVTGGLHSPVLPWYACISAVALMLSSTRAGLFWAVASGGAVTGLAVATGLGFPMWNELSPPATKFVAYTGTLTLVAAVFVLTWLFRNFEIRAQQSLREANHFLKVQALTDPLTGVPNRRSFQRTLEREWKRHERIALPLSLLVLDVDFFKRFNDAAGHAAGDECLCVLIQTVQATLHRSTDFVARIGGEEFAVVLPNTGEIDAAAIAERIRLSIAAVRIAHPDSPLADHVTVSIGSGTIVPEQHDSLSDFVQSVDRALYRAKAGGRNQAVSAESAPVALG